ncbi:hypothetical protein [Cellulosimicrobium phage DS1]|nr:hypothetical protein [Cellulosimicrobium phage DS1]
MPVEPIRLGPFIGGLNTFSDPTSIADNEVAELVNLELDLDGSLRSRPPIVQLTGELPGAAGNGIDILGYYEANGGAKYLVASNRNNATYFWNGLTWTLITNTFAATAMAQARDKAWLVAPPGSANPGGSWDPAAGFTPEANMPKGGCAIAHKDRVWIGPGKTATANGARLYTSTITSSTITWPATPVYLNIGAGDGENIIDLVVYYDSIIVFKEGSTWSFTFSGDPSTGETRKQSDNIGVNAKGCVATFQNQIYVVFDNKVYEFSNYNFNELNKKVPLKSESPDATLPEYVSASYWSDRLFIQFYEKTYVYSLKVGTWSVWESDLIDNMGRLWPIPNQQGERPVAYTYRTGKTGFLGLYRIVDAVGAESEPMVCRVKTKNYDYGSPGNFKALKNWGVNVISKVGLDAAAEPIAWANSTVTWDRLKKGPGGDGGTAYNIDKLKNLVPNPSFESPGVNAQSPTSWAAMPGTGSTVIADSSFTAQMQGSVGAFLMRSTSSGTNVLNGARSDLIPATPGKWRLIRAWVASDTTDVDNVLVTTQYYNAALASLINIGGVVSPPAFYAGQYVYHLYQNPPDAAFMRASIYQRSAVNIPAGKRLWADQVVVAEYDTQAEAQAALDMLTARGYFDASTGTPDAPVVALTDGTLERYKPYNEPNGFTWGKLNADGATWDRLIDPAVIVNDIVETAGSGAGGRKFIKLMQALRFRQINFQISARTNGDIQTAPFHLFDILTRVADKQYVPKRVN